MNMQEENVLDEKPVTYRKIPYWHLSPWASRVKGALCCKELAERETKFRQRGERDRESFSVDSALDHRRHGRLSTLEGGIVHGDYGRSLPDIVLTSQWTADWYSPRQMSPVRGGPFVILFFVSRASEQGLGTTRDFFFPLSCLPKEEGGILQHLLRGVAPCWVTDRRNQKNAY